jgi:excinuclease UvrABC nuclease subunit
MTSQGLTKLKLPDEPGVYFFMKGREILYIGKATSLRSRVRSYFATDLIHTRGSHIVDMVFKATTVKYEVTDSVLEALILEANVIKKHQPKYNTKEKDDKSFNYVVITDETIPKVLLIRGREVDIKMKTKTMAMRALFGPYPSGGAIRDGLKIIRRIFPFVDQNSIKKDNYEFYKQLGLTPDTQNIEAIKLYKERIKHIELFFAGKKKKILETLKKEMLKAAKVQAFEKAGEYKRQIFALEHINDVSLIKNELLTNPSMSRVRIEAYDVAHMSGKNMVGVMTVVIDGEAAPREYKRFIIKTQSGSNDTGALEEILSRRLRHTEWGIPDIIVTDGGVAQKRVGEQVSARYQWNVPVVSVVKDDRHKAREILGEQLLVNKHKSAILLANVEAHRFAIAFHKEKRAKDFLK